MAPHAGFAVAIAVSERTLQDLLRVLYVANQIKPVLDADIAVSTPTGVGRLTANLFVDVPRLTLTAASNGRYLLDLRAWGPMQLSLPDAGGVVRDVLLSASILVPPKLTVANNQLTFGIDAAAASLQSLTVSAIRGGPFPPLIQRLLESGVLNGSIEQAIRARLATEPGGQVALDFLGGLLTAT